MFKVMNKITPFIKYHIIEGWINTFFLLVLFFKYITDFYNKTNIR